MEKNSLYWNEALLNINTQTEKAFFLLKERHGDDYSHPLAEQFRNYGTIETISKSKAMWSGVNDTAVKEWYFETNVILENFFSPTNEYLKKFNRLIKSPEIDAIGFNSLSSGDFLKTSIGILQDCALYLEKKIHSLKNMETKKDNNTIGKDGSHGQSKKFSIFISRIDEHKEIAEKLKEYFQQIFPDRVDIFVANDPYSISFSDDWFVKIKTGIKTCDLMIILCTPDSVKRPWINFEAGAATILGKKIGPICFGGLNPSNLPSPLSFIRPHAINCSDRQNFKKHFDKMIDTISQEINLSPHTANVIETDFFKLITTYAINIELTHDVIDSVKKNLSEKNTTQMFELVNSARTIALSEFSSERFEIDSGRLVALGIKPDDCLVVNRFHEYEKITNPICRMCSRITFFDDNIYQNLIRQTMENFNFNHEFYNCRTELKNLENYPLYLINSTSGITAFVSNNFNMLASVIHKPRIIEKNTEGGISRKPIIEKIIIRDALPGLGNKYCFDSKKPDEKQAVWEHVYDNIFEQVSEFVPNKLIFLDEFQKFKFLCAMTFIDFNFDTFQPRKITPFIHEILSIDWQKGNNNMWGEREKLDKTPILDFVQQGTNLGNEWGLLKAGFFNGSIIRFNECYAKFSTHNDYTSD